MRAKIDTLRTLLWVNRQRIKQREWPIFRMPSNRYLPRYRARSQACPVARALPGNPRVAGEYYTFTGIVRHALPVYAQRYIRRQDAELWYI